MHTQNQQSSDDPSDDGRGYTPQYSLPRRSKLGSQDHHHDDGDPVAVGYMEYLIESYRQRAGETETHCMPKDLRRRIEIIAHRLYDIANAQAGKVAYFLSFPFTFVPTW